MTEVWTLVAIFGPWTMGTAICRRGGGSGFAAFARGWFVGLALVMFASPVLLNLLGAGAIKWVALIMLASGLAMARPLFSEIVDEIRTRGKHYVDPITLAWRRLTLLRKSALVVLLFVTFFMVFSKIMIGAIALAWIPARCEDALAYWLFKAKVITFLGHVPLDPSDPFYLGGSNPNYPLYPSMIAVWIPLVVGQWSESLSVLPWFLTFINLPLAAATGLPRETPRPIQIAIAYVLLSLPLAVIHVFRPGYVDLILASFLMCGVSLIFEWRNQQRMGTLIIAMCLLIAAACTKREGVVAVAAVLAVFFAVQLVDRVRGRTSAKSLGALLIAATSAGVAIWFLMNHSDLSKDASKWGYHPVAWAALRRHAFEWSSFSLFFPFALASIAGILILRRSANGYLATALCLALFAYAASPFLLTDNVRFALNDQTPSRLLLHIAPAMAVALAYGYTRGRTCSEPTN